MIQCDTVGQVSGERGIWAMLGRSENVPGVMMLKLCLKDSLVREGNAVDWAAGFPDGGRQRVSST